MMVKSLQKSSFLEPVGRFQQSNKTRFDPVKIHNTSICSLLNADDIVFISNSAEGLQRAMIKGPVTGYGKLTWEFAHAWNFMKLCALIVLVMTAIIMVYSLVNSIPLANYDVIYDVNTIAKSTTLNVSIVVNDS